MTQYLRINTSRLSSLVLLVTFVIISVTTVAAVNYTMRHQALTEAEAKARLILDRNLAIHTYFSQDMKPKLFEWTSPFRSQEYFDPTWMSSTYGVRKIDAYFRSLNGTGYYYKECAVSARSPENEADEFEQSFLNRLNQDPALDFWAGIRTFDGKPFFVTLRKAEIVEDSCLRCHSEPKDAPLDMVKLYGEDRSFHRQVGEVASAISIRIPLSDAYSAANAFSLRLSGILLAAIGVLFLIQQWINSRYIFRPLSQIRRKALEISASADHLGEEIPLTHGRDLVEMTNAFNLMSKNLQRNKDNLEALVFDRTRDLEIANKQLLEGSARYRLLAESINDIIALTDLDGNFLYISPSVQKVTGWSAKEALLMNSLDVVHHNDLKALKKAYQAQQGDKSDKILQWRCRCKDGQYVWLETNTHLVLDQAGNPEHFVSSSRDISSRKQMEHALRASEEKFSKVFHASPAPIAISELDTGCFVEVNEAFSAVTGYTRDETIGHSSVKLGFFPSEDKRLALVHQLKQTGRLKGLELDFLNKSGKPVTILGSAELIQMEGHSYIVSIGVDISERKRAEEERAGLEARLRQAQKLEAIGTLAGGIAHDFNNILGIIMGYGEISQMSLPGDSMAHESITQVLQAAERARDLVRQILTVSRKSDMERRPLQAAPIIKEAAKMLRAALPTTIEIKLNMQITLQEDVILADPTEIHQLVMNLCTNAGHAMRGKGGLLGICVESVRFEPDAASKPEDLAPGDYLHLTVSDTGHGMEASLLERIFDPYFTTKGPGEGTGLGLAVVHGIVRSCGGAIHVESEPGIGTSFHVYLPALIMQCEAVQEASLAVRGGTEHILLVDDEENLVKVGRKILETLGYRVTEAFSGVQALDVFRRQPDAFDLVITDYTMPLMTGIDLTEELLRLRPGLPVILCTGCIEGMSQTEAKASGIRQFILKPLSKAVLAQIVRKVLDRGENE